MKSKRQISITQHGHAVHINVRCLPKTWLKMPLLSQLIFASNFTQWLSYWKRGHHLYVPILQAVQSNLVWDPKYWFHSTTSSQCHGINGQQIKTILMLKHALPRTLLSLQNFEHKIAQRLCLLRRPVHQEKFTSLRGHSLDSKIHLSNLNNWNSNTFQCSLFYLACSSTVETNISNNDVLLCFKIAWVVATWINNNLASS